MFDQEFFHNITQQMIINEEQVLVKALSQYLGTDIITSEHMKHVTMVYKHGEGDKYGLMYGGKHLGTIHKKWNGYQYWVEFIPLSNGFFI